MKMSKYFLREQLDFLQKITQISILKKLRIIKIITIFALGQNISSALYLYSLSFFFTLWSNNLPPLKAHNKILPAATSEKGSKDVKELFSN